MAPARCRIEQAHDAWSTAGVRTSFWSRPWLPAKQAIAVAPEQANGCSNIGSALLEQAYFDFGAGQIPAARPKR